MKPGDPCEWFALCSNHAYTFAYAPDLHTGEPRPTPVCDRCATQVGLDGGDLFVIAPEEVSKPGP